MNGDQWKQDTIKKRVVDAGGLYQNERRATPLARNARDNEKIRQMESTGDPGEDH